MLSREDADDMLDALPGNVWHPILDVSTQRIHAGSDRRPVGPDRGIELQCNEHGIALHWRRVAGIVSFKPLGMVRDDVVAQDRKSTRLNSSHANISYAVF